MKRLLSFMTSFVVSMLCIFPSVAMAAWPEKPVTLICPYGAGGSTDIQARVLAGALEKVLKQPVIIKNISGAGGLPGTQAAITAQPDGYTFGYLPLGPLVMQPHLRNIPSQVEDFAYVARIINAPYVLFTSANSQWKSFDAMLQDILANPKKYRYASSGAGTQPHIAMEDLFGQFGAKIQHIAFHSDADAMQSMAGGHVQVSTAPMSVVQQYGVKPLMVYDSKPMAALQDVPPVTKLGKDVIYTHWHVVTAPKGTPKAIIDALSKAIESLSTDAGYLSRLEKLAMEPAYLGPEATHKMVQEEFAKYKGIIQRVIVKE